MSGLALPALGLANRAAQALPALFADLPQRAPGHDIARLESSGYDEAGKGAGTYVNDGLCDAALLAAHPNFVFETANGRIFRLRPEAGSISVEQGGASGDGATNDQAHIQAAIDYAHAVDARELRFESAHYRIDCPPRLSPSEETRALDGHPLVVRKSLSFKGCAPKRTVLDFKAMDGADPETDWQLVARSSGNPTLAVWRGGGIFLEGDVPDPGEGQRSIDRLEFDRMILKGGRQNTGVWTYPADPSTGDGWDVTDRAIWAQDCFIGEIICRDTDMIGWKGEIFYLAGAANSTEKVVLERCRFATSNGSAFNPGIDCEVIATDSSFGDCFQAQEDVAKTRAVYRNCQWHDCDHVGLGSGSANGVYYAQAYPTRYDTLAPPVTLLDNCEFRDIRSVKFFSWVRGNIRTIDCTVSLNGNESLALRDTDLKIEAWLDRADAIHALTFTGVNSLTELVPNAPAGIFKQPPAQVRLRLSHHRTKLAEDNARQWLGSYWTGYIEPTCQLHVEGDCAGGRLPHGGANPTSMPLVTYDHGQATTQFWPYGWYKLAPLTGSGEIAPASPYMTLRMASGIIADMTLARAPAGGSDYGYAGRQRIRMVKQGATGSIRFVKGASPSFGVLETRVLENEYDWIEFSWNRDLDRWEEEGFFSDA